MEEIRGSNPLGSTDFDSTKCEYNPGVIAIGTLVYSMKRKNRATRYHPQITFLQLACRSPSDLPKLSQLSHWTNCCLSAILVLPSTLAKLILGSLFSPA